MPRLGAGDVVVGGFMGLFMGIEYQILVTFSNGSVGTGKPGSAG